MERPGPWTARGCRAGLIALLLLPALAGCGLFDDEEILEGERIRIRPRLEDKDHMEPEGSTLAAGDRLVIAGQAGLKEGARVRVLRPGAASVDATAAAEAQEGDPTAESTPERAPESTPEKAR